MGVVCCAMPEIPRKGKKNIQSFCYSLEFVVCQWMVYVDLQNEQIVRYYIVIQTCTTSRENMKSQYNKQYIRIIFKKEQGNTWEESVQSLRIP